MALFDKKIQAHRLRRSGKSIKDIATTLQISKGTASVWCREIQLTSHQSKKLHEKQIAAGHRGRMRGALVNKERKEANVLIQENDARDMVGTLSDRDKLMLGIGLYWGEGTKSSSSGVSLVNSDAEMVKFALDWFEMLGITKDNFNPYIFISEQHQSREKALVSFWSKYLDIPEKQFNKVIFLKGRRKKVYENHNSYYGILALRVRKSTTLKYKILGLIKAVKSG
jgi:hypothetical protein